jgi:hypothetical protein
MPPEPDPTPSTPPTPPAPEPPKPADPPAPEGLGDAGKRALDAEREARRAAEARAKELDAELEKFRAASMSDQEKAIKAAEKAAAAEADKRWSERIVRAEAKAAAAGKVVDVNAAVRLIDLSAIPMTDGEVDAKALAAAIDGLVTDYPFLAATAGGAKPPTPTVPGGPRGDGKGSITEDQLKTMKPDEIVAAMDRGDLDHLIKG